MFASIARITSGTVSPFARLALGTIPKCIAAHSFATVSDVDACSKAFDDIIGSRNSCRKYKNQEVSEALLNHILSQTLVTVYLLVTIRLPLQLEIGNHTRLLSSKTSSLVKIFLKLCQQRTRMWSVRLLE